MWFYGEEDLVERSENLVDFADGCLQDVRYIPPRKFRVSYLVLEEYGGVEVWNLDVDCFADNLAFAGVDELAHFCALLALGRLNGYKKATNQAD